jgi:hypothetical protein
MDPAWNSWPGDPPAAKLQPARDPSMMATPNSFRDRCSSAVTDLPGEDVDVAIVLSSMPVACNPNAAASADASS